MPDAETATLLQHCMAQRDVGQQVDVQRHAVLQAGISYRHAAGDEHDVVNDSDGEFVLMLHATVLRAQSRWRLHEKMGRPLAVIHQPVPLYADQSSAPVDRFMRHLKTGKLAERLNWSVTDDPALFQIEGKHRIQPDPTITVANAAFRLFLRVERQTLSRLPGSGFVLFTIRVHSYPLTRVLAQPGAAARLAEALRALPTSMAAYKSLPPFRDALLSHLHAVSQA